ncbi:hypothetical protein MH131_19525, partial [Bacillus safensis]|uniref:hypothetical protein n=1 Tax=Bacillus safensis TaxID=561879 RepID=UPI00227E8759
LNQDGTKPGDGTTEEPKDQDGTKPGEESTKGISSFINITPQACSFFWDINIENFSAFNNRCVCKFDLAPFLDKKNNPALKDEVKTISLRG